MIARLALTLALLSGCATTNSIATEIKEHGMDDMWALINGGTEYYLVRCNENPTSQYCKDLRKTLMAFSAGYVKFNDELEGGAK